MSSTPKAIIYRRELWPVLFTLLLAPPQTKVLTDNKVVYYVLTKDHGRTFYVPEALAATVVLVNKAG